MHDSKPGSAPYQNPVEVIWGTGALAQLPQSLENSESILLLYGRASLRSSSAYDTVMKSLEGRHVTHLGGITPLPDVRDLAEVLDRSRLTRFDTILAVGGGSVIDTAKVVKAFNGGTTETADDLRSAIRSASYAIGSSPIIAVPTIAGSGSEVTRWATVWDRELALKYSVDDPALYPRTAIVDPSLTETLQVRAAIISAMDALCHATEAYWANGSNELSRIRSLAAIPELLKGITELLSLEGQVDARRARERLSAGSLMAGEAFSHTRTTACHAISYPLSLHFGIEHGIATVMTLSAVLALNVLAISDPSALFKALGISEPVALQQQLDRAAAKAGFSLKLRDYGVPRHALQAIVPQCYTKGRMDNNPVPLEERTILSILEAIY